MNDTPSTWLVGKTIVALACPWIAISMVGCTLNRLGNEEVVAEWERQQANAPWRAASYAQLPVTRPAVDSEESPATKPASAIESTERLRDYILCALRDNPDILRAEELTYAKAARISQATALPDPMLMTKTLPTPVRMAEGDNYFTLGFNQKLLVPGKLDRAGKVALEETRMAIADWENVRLRVIADVKRAWFRIYIIDRSMVILRENQELMRRLVDTARGQVVAGKRTQDDVLRAQVELANLDARLIELRRQRIAAEAMLNNLLNRKPTTPIVSPEPFDIREVHATLSSMLAKATEVNPELQRIQKQMDRDREAVDLAQLAYWPDFTLGFEWMLMESRDAFVPPINPQTGQRPKVSQMSEDGSDNWAIFFGFNIPLWHDRIEGGIREAKRRLSASTHAHTSARNLLYFRVEEALANVEAHRSLAELFDSTIIPQARQAYEIARAGYQVGQSDFQYVIDNWQKWLDFTIQYHRALGELERGVADLEQAVGQSLEEMEAPFHPAQ